MHKIKLSPLSVNDLIEIKKYITAEFNDKHAVQRITSHILARVEELKNFPLLGEALEHKINVPTNYRYLVCENYLVFYRVENNEICIIRILYAKSDYLSTLFV